MGVVWGAFYISPRGTIDDDGEGNNIFFGKAKAKRYWYMLLQCKKLHRCITWCVDCLWEHPTLKIFCVVLFPEASYPGSLLPLSITHFHSFKPTSMNARAAKTINGKLISVFRREIDFSEVDSSIWKAGRGATRGKKWRHFLPDNLDSH